MLSIFNQISATLPKLYKVIANELGGRSSISCKDKVYFFVITVFKPPLWYNPAFYIMDTGGCFLGVKRDLNAWSYASSYPYAFMRLVCLWHSSTYFLSWPLKTSTVAIKFCGI
jgi:hypothetical protein